MARALLLENYAAMPSSFAPSLTVLIERIVDHGELPVLLFCMEGKDRTGFVTAVLLSALGVLHEDVIADYLASDPFYDSDLVRGVLADTLSLPADRGPSDAVISAMRVNRDYLARAFEVIDADYGGVQGYLQRAGGLDPPRTAALRDLLLEASPRPTHSDAP